MASRSRRRSRFAGFTLIELMVVMSLIVILASIGLALYANSVTRAKESVLKEDLFRMRDAIDQYYADKGKYPASLRGARVGEVPADDSGGSVHELGRHVARDPVGAGPDQSDGAARRVRCAEADPSKRRSTEPTIRTGTDEGRSYDSRRWSALVGRSGGGVRQGAAAGADQFDDHARSATRTSFR